MPRLSRSRRRRSGTPAAMFRATAHQAPTGPCLEGAGASRHCAILTQRPCSSRHRLAYTSSGLCSICACLHHLGAYPPNTFELDSLPIWKDFSLLANRLSFRLLFLRPCLPATSDADILPWRGQYVASHDRGRSSPAPALSDSSSTLQNRAPLQSGWRRKSPQRPGMTSLFDPSLRSPNWNL